VALSLFPIKSALWNFGCVFDASDSCVESRLSHGKREGCGCCVSKSPASKGFAGSAAVSGDFDPTRAAGCATASCRTTRCIGASCASRAVDEVAGGEEELGGADVEVQAVALGRDRVEHAADGRAGVDALPLEAGGDLRHPAVGIEHGVASELDLDAEDVELERRVGDDDAV
jgi:hypothetical protein